MESILNSVKKLLGIDECSKEFDLDIMMNINAAIATLTQLGVGPPEGFIVTSKDDTYEDFIGDDQRFEHLKMYLYYKTKLGFDPPASTSVLECMKEMIKECEFRLNILVDPPDTFLNENNGEESDIDALHHTRGCRS